MKSILCALLAPLAISAQNLPRQLHTYMVAAANTNHFNGNVLVAHGDTIIYEHSFGKARHNTAEPLSADAVFHIGKSTEQFTAAAILLLKAAGKLQLTDTITKYFPQLPYKNITLHHLLSHTAGLPDYYELMKDKYTEKKYAGNNDVINYLAAARAPLLFEPGSAYADDFTGYALLASVIEKVSGKTYADFIRENIFKPLQLQHTYVFAPAAATKEIPVAEGMVYDEKKGKYINADSFVVTIFPPNILYIVNGIKGSTGIYSSVQDLFRWSRALKNNQVLNAGLTRQMFSRYALKDTAGGMYSGYGVYTGKNEIGNYVLSQEGGNAAAGYFASSIRYTQEDYTIITVSNTDNDENYVNGPLAYILYGKDVIPPYVHKQVAIDTPTLFSYAGRYALPNIVELFGKDGKLYMHTTAFDGEAEDIMLLPESGTKLFAVGDDFQMEFEKDNDGKIIKSYAIIRGMKKEIKKL